MNYIENIYICLAAPLLVAIICMHPRGRKSLLFLLGGMTACLLSAYISTFLAAFYGADTASASIEIAPLVEESMKLMPVLFYMLVFEPGKDILKDNIVLLVAIGFATFENVCYLIQNGASEILHLLIRGFGTGAVHVVCGAIIGFGLHLLWDRLWIRAAGIVALLAVAITYHAIYNILVSQKGAPEMIGYLIPLLTVVLAIILRFTLRGSFHYYT